MRVLRSRVAVVVAALLALTALFPVRASAVPPQHKDAADKAVAYIVEQYRSNGFAPYGSTDAGMLADAVIALSALDARPDVVQEMLVSLKKTAPDYVSYSAPGLAKIILTASAAGQNPRTFLGCDRDLVAELQKIATDTTHPQHNSLFGYWGPYLTAVALIRAGEPVPAKVLDAVFANQATNGGFGYKQGSKVTTDPDYTGIAIYALGLLRDSKDRAVADRANKSLQSAIGWATDPANQRTDKAGNYYWATYSSANSTGILASALAEVGVNVESPIAYLKSQQQMTGVGAWSNVPDGKNADLRATVQAVLPLAGRGYGKAATTQVPELSNCAAPSPSAPVTTPVPTATTTTPAPGTTTPVPSVTTPVPTTTTTTPAPGTSTPVPSVTNAPRNHAGPCVGDEGVTVVIDYQSLGGAPEVRCFVGTPKDGVDAIRGAGFTMEGAARWGDAFICRLNGRPAADEVLDIPNDPTYTEKCRDTPPAAAYWSYWQSTDQGKNWSYSQVGAKGHKPKPGEWEGWSFSYRATADTNPWPRTDLALAPYVTPTPTAPPVTVTPTVTGAPVTVTPTVTAPPVTATPTVTGAPVTTTPTVSAAPVTVTPTVTAPATTVTAAPVTVTPTVTKAPVTATPTVTGAPVTVTPTVTAPATTVTAAPVTVTPTVTKAPVTATPTVTGAPVTVTPTVTAPASTVTAAPVTVTPTVTGAPITVTPTVTAPKPTTPAPKPTTPAPKPTAPVLKAPYEVPGFHTINGRRWNTTCEPYGNTIRCWTYIWSKQAVKENGQYKLKEGWHFNNLTYLPYLTKAQWGTHHLANTGEYTINGRKWRTECNTKVTGKNACRSYIWATVIVPQRDAQGRYTFRQNNQWVFNNMVRFKVS